MNTENNKIIAEFMGYENIKNPKEHPIYKIPQFAYDINDYGSITEVNTFSPYFDDMKFNTSFDWLMEVVEKIESLKPIQLMDRNWIGFDVRIYKTFNTQTHYCTIKYLKEGGDMTIANGFSKQSKIEAVYNACVEFIKWYNEQNK